MGNNGLQYGRSYAGSGLKAFAKSFEELNSDIFFCQFAQEILSTSKPQDVIRDAVVHMTEIASYVFTEHNLEFAIHGYKRKFPLIQMKLELLLNQIKNENSRYMERQPTLETLQSEFQEPVYHKMYFKTPLAVNNCVESMIGPTYANHEDYGVGLVLSELMTFSFLIPYVREKGGAYGAGCAMNESGLIDFYSFRDPKIQRTYSHFERAIQDVIGGKFSLRELQEAKLLAFQKLDKVLEPSYKGLLGFTRGYTDEHRLHLRLRALDCSKADLQEFAQKYMMSAVEKGETSRVVFGSQHENAELQDLLVDDWNAQSPMDFLSNSYFERWNDEVLKRD